MISMAQTFAHGGMPGHGGMQHGGHPMTQGHPSNQGAAGGQPGVSMGQQMHMGMASGPGAPQVTQAGQMMGGIPHNGGPGGVGPNAHAMSHLAAHPQSMLQQQQQIQQASTLNSQSACIFPWLLHKPLCK
jgi:hypothetical protein